MRTGTTNEHLKGLIQKLKKLSIESKANLWKRLAQDLEKPTRSRRVVNLSRLNRVTSEGETIVIPGKLLGAGELAHKLTVATFACSDSAKDKIEKLSGNVISLEKLMESDPKGQKIRIIG